MAFGCVVCHLGWLIEEHGMAWISQLPSQHHHHYHRELMLTGMETINCPRIQGLKNSPNDE